QREAIIPFNARGRQEYRGRRFADQPGYLLAARPLSSKSRTFEPGLTSLNRLLLELYSSGITDTSSSMTSDGMVGFLTFLLIVMVLRIEIRYLPGRRPCLISYFPSLLIPPPPPGPGVPSVGSSAIDPWARNCPSNRTVPLTVGSDSRRNQKATPTPPRPTNPPAASQIHRASFTVETPYHDGANWNEGGHQPEMLNSRKRSRPRRSPPSPARSSGRCSGKRSGRTRRP